MKYLSLLCLTLLLGACEKPTKPTAQAPAADAPGTISRSVVRINSTSQAWNPGQPWEKTPPQSLRSLGAIVGPGQVLTTSEMVADTTFLELELPDGSKTAEAVVIAVDYEANIALLTVKSEAERNEFFKDTQPIALAPRPSIGDTLEIFQIEDNATTIKTSGTLKSVSISNSFLPNQSFLTYMLKASMQGAASSFSLPVTRDGKLAGLLLSYSSEDQLCDVLSIDVISRFLGNIKDGAYAGFPSLGVAIASTEDPAFRKFLKLSDSQGGIYISSVKAGGSADVAGVKEGDVLLSADGFPIDMRGFYENPHYGLVFWGHIIRGEKTTGDSIKLALLRDGMPIEITAKLTRAEAKDKLVPDYQFDRAPNFLVKGGLIFQELNRPFLEAFGKEWASRAPLNLLDVFENPEKFVATAKRVIFLSGSIPTPATVGYEGLRNFIVKKVNGIEIDSMKTLIEAFEKPNAENLHAIEFREENFTVYLDEAVSTAVDSALLQRGLNMLSRAE